MSNIGPHNFDQIPKQHCSNELINPNSSLAFNLILVDSCGQLFDIAGAHEAVETHGVINVATLGGAAGYYYIR